MKKKILLSFAIMVSIMVFGTISALAATYGDLTYTVSNGEVIIEECRASAITVEIPSQINGYPVTSIGDEAFMGCTGLTSVNVPKSVVGIGRGTLKIVLLLKK